MIPKRGRRLSEKIMLPNKLERDEIIPLRAPGRNSGAA